jgi:transcriptional regulator with XRE-family HTH domain
MRFRERIGLNIQNLRHSKGLSQEQLALAANMDRSYVSEIELAKSSVSADILEQIARVFEVDPHELTKGRLDMPDLSDGRQNAEPIGRIMCITTDAEIGLLYCWDNGDTQIALHAQNGSETPSAKETEVR